MDKIYEFSSELTDRQVAVLNHYIDVMGFKLSNFYLMKSQEFLTDLFPVDIAIFGPTDKFNYYTLTTVGLSQYLFPKFFQRVELSMVLPPTWKPEFSQMKYRWAVNFLSDIAYQIVEHNIGVQIGQVYVFDGENGELPYPEQSDAIGGIVCLPEMFPFEIIELVVENSFTRIFQIMTITKDELTKIDDIGPKDFILYDLHDADKPLMVVPLKEPKGIDKIITKNESSLKGR